MGQLSFDEMVRLLGRLHRGFATRSYYSGMDCPGQGLHALVRFLEHTPLPHGLTLSKADRSEWRSRSPIRHVHACDIDPACCQLLLEWGDEATRPLHLFGDICSRVEPAMLTSMEDNFHAAQGNHMRLRAHLQEVQKLPAEYGHIAVSCKKEIAQLSEDTVDHIMKMLRAEGVFTHTQRDWCYMHHQVCVVDDPRDNDCVGHARIPMVVAGNSCTDVSARGTGHQFLGNAFIPLAVFVMERRCRAEMLMILECTPRADPRIYEKY